MRSPLDRHRQLRAVFDALLLDSPGGDAYLADACAGDPEFPGQSLTWQVKGLRAGKVIGTNRERRRQMVHFHWPRWASHVMSDVEHQGELQIIGFVVIVTMLGGLLISSSVTAVVELFQHLG